MLEVYSSHSQIFFKSLGIFSGQGFVELDRFLDGLERSFILSK